MAALPPFIRGKLDRAEIDTIDKLFTKINLLDLPTKTISFNTTTLNKKPQSSFRHFNPSKCLYSSCSYCEKRRFPGRMHFESECRLKIADEEKKKTKTKPSGNNNKNYSRMEDVNGLYDPGSNISIIQFSKKN